MLTIGKRHNSLDSFKFLDNTNYNQQMYGHLQDGRFDLESQRHVLDYVQTKCLCEGPKCRCMEAGCVQQKASCLLADDKDTKYKHKVHKGNLNLGQSWEQ